MSDCGVCIGGNDYEPWDFYHEKVVTARKPYKCGECYREIPKGAKYQRIVGKCCDSIDTYITCLDCKNIRSGLSCGPVGLGMLWDEVGEVFSEIVSTACLAKIPTASAKAYFLDRWRQWKGLAA
jgi:hypothetical protein